MTTTASARRGRETSLLATSATGPHRGGGHVLSTRIVRVDDDESIRSWVQETRAREREHVAEKHPENAVV